MQLDQGFDQRQSQPRAAAITANETVEQIGLNVERYAAASIGNLQAHLAHRPLRAEGDAPARWGQAQGVLDQMVHSLGQASGIATDVIERVVAVGDDFDLGPLGLGRPAGSSLLQQVERLILVVGQHHFVGVDLGDVEHVFDGAGQLHGRAAHACGIALAAL